MDIDAVIEENRLLIYKIAQKFYNIDMNDLFQAGCIGIIKAVKKFQDDGTCKFSTFAYKYIFGEMYELASKSRNIKMNKAYLKMMKLIESARSVLTQKLGRFPTISEISMYTELEESIIEEVLILSKETISLDDEYNEDDNLCLYNQIGNTYDYDTQILINDSINSLDEPMRSIMIYRINDYTQSEIAEHLGLSQVKVSRLENKGKAKIKEYISA